MSDYYGYTHERSWTGVVIGVIVALAIVVGVYLLFSSALVGKEPSKPRAYGVNVFRDHATGCEYINGGLSSAITPRLDADGKHICTAPDPIPHQENT